MRTRPRPRWSPHDEPEASTSDGDALIWHRRAQQITWSRLLAGEITEVFVFGTPNVPERRGTHVARSCAGDLLDRSVGRVLRAYRHAA